MAKKQKKSNAENNRNYSRNINYKKKDEMIALLIAIIPALLGFAGLGQIYVGKLQRGILILLGGWVIAAVNVFSAVLVIPLCLTVPIGIIFIVWQAYDAKKIAEEYNEVLAKKGKPPW